MTEGLRLTKGHRRRMRRCPLCCISLVWSMRAERGKNDDDSGRTSGRVAEGRRAAIRKIIRTTDTMESLNRVLRKTQKTGGSFPGGEAAAKLIVPAFRTFEKGGRKIAARNQPAGIPAGRVAA